MHLHAILLAAGQSSRMGTQNKLRLPLRGRPVVYHAAKAFLDAGLEVLVVLGHEAETIRFMLPESKRIKTVFSPRYQSGLAYSLSIGLRRLPPETRWALVGLGDMPMVKPTTIARLAAKTKTAQNYAIVPTFRGEWGNPVALSHHMIRECLTLEGDTGAGQILRRNPQFVEEMPVADEGVVRDVDTPELYAAMRRLDRY
jgi:molybdenum cofactor cytidylyltransferase